MLNLTHNTHSHMVQRRKYSDGSFSFHAKKDIQSLDYYLQEANKHTNTTNLIVKHTQQGMLVEVVAVLTNLSKSQANEYKNIVEQTHKFLGYTILESKV